MCCDTESTPTDGERRPVLLFVWATNQVDIHLAEHAAHQFAADSGFTITGVIGRAVNCLLWTAERGEYADRLPVATQAPFDALWELYEPIGDTVAGGPLTGLADSLDAAVSHR